MKIGAAQNKHSGRQFDMPALDPQGFIDPHLRTYVLEPSKLHVKCRHNLLQIIYPKKDVSIEGCPEGWNVTLETAAAENSAAPTEGLDWWYHLSIYDISYMWYAGVACMIVVVVGSLASIVFSFVETGNWRKGEEVQILSIILMVLIQKARPFTKSYI